MIVEGRDAAADIAFIAVDWGTTSARAYAVDASGRVQATRSAPFGVQQLQDAGFAHALERLLDHWNALRVPRFAAGMIGSRQGWIEAPYADCPADLEKLGDKLAWTPGRELAIVPGLLYRDEQGVPDVMRGEETQLAGVLGDDDAERTFIAVLPGTHSKWAYVERGRVLAFRTYMTGEVFGVLVKHSILGRLATEPGVEAATHAAFDSGVARGLSDAGTLHTMFGARTLALTGDLPSASVSDWLSGCLIGSEIASARRWLAQRGGPHGAVRIIGSDALVPRYASALALAGMTATPAAGEAVVRGLIRIARKGGYW